MKKKGIDLAIDKIASELENLQGKFERLLYVGRFCPTHLGHQALMGGMIKAFPKGHTVLIGSCNEPMSLRNLFDYSDRRAFITTLFPDCNVGPMPDFVDDGAWFHALDDLIRLTGSKPEQTAFIGGCEEDVAWYYRNARNVHIVNRFSGTTVNVSGTEIRDRLIIHDRQRLKKLLDVRIIDQVVERFDQRWAEFRRQ